MIFHGIECFLFLFVLSRFSMCIHSVSHFFFFPLSRSLLFIVFLCISRYILDSVHILSAFSTIIFPFAILCFYCLLLCFFSTFFRLLDSFFLEDSVLLDDIGKTHYVRFCYRRLTLYVFFCTSSGMGNLYVNVWTFASRKCKAATNPFSWYLYKMFIFFANLRFSTTTNNTFKKM